ncbi:uncharacterized protein LTR77_001508 [Saxophila tyrrhenica]|uniref:Uncharacterized protein n=1 Tax=Saxophila tyrrhenica TaxID=1690608 RepID=A0AAV9PN14_9PEZI|nr:hypothetical protein LTR77_001508 [Saxophila tyrrhenica]
MPPSTPIGKDIPSPHTPSAPKQQSLAGRARVLRSEDGEGWFTEFSRVVGVSVQLQEVWNRAAGSMDGGEAAEGQGERGAKSDGEAGKEPCRSNVPETSKTYDAKIDYTTTPAKRGGETTRSTEQQPKRRHHTTLPRLDTSVQHSKRLEPPYREAPRFEDVTGDEPE